jgi:DNA-binding XRE family transcriptional regulator
MSSHPTSAAQRVPDAALTQSPATHSGQIGLVRPDRSNVVTLLRDTQVRVDLWQLPSFGQLLQEFRIACGLTQEELAEKAGLSARGISDLERGARRRPRSATLRLLAEALQLVNEERAILEASANRARDP